MIQLFLNERAVAMGKPINDYLGSVTGLHVSNGQCSVDCLCVGSTNRERAAFMFGWR